MSPTTTPELSRAGSAVLDNHGHLGELKRPAGEGNGELLGTMALMHKHPNLYPLRSMSATHPEEMSGRIEIQNASLDAAGRAG